MDPLLELIRTAAQVIGLLQKPDNNTDNKQKGTGNTYIENQYNYYSSKAEDSQKRGPDESSKESDQPSTRPTIDSPEPWSPSTRRFVLGTFSTLLLLIPFSECSNVIEPLISSYERLHLYDDDYRREQDSGRQQRIAEWSNEFIAKHPDTHLRDPSDINRFCAVKTVPHIIWAIPVGFIMQSVLESLLTQKRAET